MNKAKEAVKQSSSKKDPRIGMVVSERFEIISELGKGGFATVYRGNQLGLDQPVAVKILDIGSDEPDIFLERFLREARTAAQIRHPDIVNIIDFGSTEHNDPYIVLELLDGVPLDKALKSGPLEPRRAHKLFIRCLDALQAAHEQGVIHRDLKPANLFLSQAGSMVETLKILDFGIATATEKEQEKLTATGQLLGTPSFLPPEYIQDHKVSPRLDVYQMGLIFVEVLTGRSVVEGKSMYQSMLAHCTGELNIPAELLASPVGAVIARAVTMNLELRYENAGAFRDALSLIDPQTIPNASVYVFVPDESGGSIDTGETSNNFAPNTGPNTGTASIIASLASRPHITQMTLLENQTLAPSTLEPQSAGTPPALNRKLMMTAVAVFFITLLLGVTLAVLLVSKEETQVVAANTTKEKPVVDETPKTEPLKEEPPKTDVKKIPEPVVATSTTTITIKPAEAEIFKGGERIGTGTATLTFKGDNPPSKLLQVRADGYEMREVEVKPGQEAITIDLKAKPSEVEATNTKTPVKTTGDKGKPRGKNAGKVAAQANSKTPSGQTDAKTPAAPTEKPKPKLGIIEDDSKKKKTGMGIIE